MNKNPYRHIPTLVEDIVRDAHNPAAMQHRVMETLKSLDNSEVDYMLNDPTDPVAWAIETACVLGHATMEASRLELPKQYPILSQNMEDIYKHMSDKDHIDIFAQPAFAPFMLILDKRDLMDKAVVIDERGNRKLVIPRDSYVSVAGYDFAIQYPIELKVLSHGAIQVVWDTDVQSPITNVVSDALDWSITRVPTIDSDLIRIDIPMLQYSVKTYSDTVVPSMGWKSDFSFKDQFFMTRVWQKTNHVWEELRVSYAQDVYDVKVPTAVVRVFNKKMFVSIPEIYMNTGLVSGEIRVDVYETHGPLSVNLSNYPADDYKLTISDLSNEIEAKYYNPIGGLSMKQVISPGSVSGGRPALTFEQLRERVITNTVGARLLPITEKQLVAKAGTLGMEISKPIDYVTSRLYNASSEMLESSLVNVSSPIGTAALPWDFTMSELENLPTVRDNGKRQTLEPETIFHISESKLKIHRSATIGWQSLRNQNMVVFGNAEDLFYTPYYTVIDTNSNTLDCRVYDLAEPKVCSKRFVDTNETTEVDVVTGSYKFFTTKEGYKLQLITKSQKSYKDLADEQVFAQISFTPRGSEGTYAHLNGKLIGMLDKERVWEFDLGSNIDIDRNHDMIMETFALSNQATKVPMPLDVKFNVFYGTKDFYPQDYKRHEMDTIIKAPTRDSFGVTWEELHVTVGKSLAYMWSKSRALTGSVQYHRYAEDVVRTYPRDVHKLDANDNKIYTLTEVNGKPHIEFEYLHRKGDPVLNEENEPEILHQRGTVMLDEAGNPLVKNQRTIKYRCEMSVFDARYMFANTDEVMAYRDAVRRDVTYIVTEVIPTFAQDLLERTHLYYKPKTTITHIEIRRDDGSTDYMDAELQYTLRFYLTSAQRNNGELMQAIGASTRRLLAQHLATNKTVSVSDITKALKKELASSVITLEMDKMGPLKDLGVFTVLTEASHASIAKKLQVEPDGRIGLRDDIILNFNRHNQEKDK